MFGNFLYYDSLPGRGLCPLLICLSFYLLYFVLPPFKDNGLLFWVPVCPLLAIRSFFVQFAQYSNVFFNEFVGVSASSSSTILAPPPCYLFLISSARSIPFLSFIEPNFAWNVLLVSLIFLRRSLVFPILFPLILCIDH